MKRMLSAVAVLLLTVAAFAQTASAPAIPAINCPDVETLIASIPANLWPAPNLRGQAMIDQGAKFKAWSDAHAKGKVVNFSILKPIMVNNSASFTPTKAMTTVSLVNLGGATASTLKCEQIAVVNNNGKFSIFVVVIATP